MSAATPLVPIALGCRGLLVVLAGPSGVGKSSLREALMADPIFVFSVSATTRAPRRGERDGEHYRFVDTPRFLSMQRDHELLESVEVYAGTWYGTPRAPAEEAVRRGRVMLLDIDVIGSQRLLGCGLPLRRLFVAPPSLEALETRLRGRGTESEAQLEKRRARWRRELDEADRFDAVVINDDLQAAVVRAHRHIARWYEQQQIDVRSPSNP